MSNFALAIKKSIKKKRVNERNINKKRANRMVEQIKGKSDAKSI